jgi:hypothetical protein
VAIEDDAKLGHFDRRKCAAMREDQRV